ncbi:MAG: DmsC/YnfH family molybdoenzyme membrane anchor subunit [Burkholderiales bacterium]
MSKKSGFGPNPWHQTSWDWRAAGNYIGGGCGTGLLLVTALWATAAPASLWAPDWLVFAGLALVGLGLLCVWLEIGRPLRALNVFINPRTSWMSREALVSVVLFPAGLAAMLGQAGAMWLTAALALAFLYCQSRMLSAARGIPAWRAVWLSPLFVLTGLCEGAGIFLLLGLFHARLTSALLMAFPLILALRMMVWWRYRGEVESGLALPARRALERAGLQMTMYGTNVPIVLLVVGTWWGGTAQSLMLALSGACAAWAGANMKYTLVTRAAYNQGFALSHIPVRGVRTVAPSKE